MKKRLSSFGEGTSRNRLFAGIHTNYPPKREKIQIIYIDADSAAITTNNI
jgi:hypothetical protein